MKNYLVFTFLSCIAFANNNESNFFYVKDFPTINGIKIVEYREKDSQTEIFYIKEIYEEKHENYDKRIIAVKFSCLESLIPKSYNIVTEQIIIKKGISSYLTVENNELYMKVYVKDNDNKIRLYENLNPSNMSELTKKFIIKCDQI